ncbi:MAG TPA: fatty acid--CoA ligase family protein, partial [Pseudonocardiaceae bacterium]|nr:fatty acid--CoA ligase family protein [Pseudonocardiaceae bacterium]
LTNPIADRLAEATAESGVDALGPLRLLVDGTRPWASAFPAQDDVVRAHAIAPQRDDTPLICYWTSGTTGDPKGVVHDQRLVRNVWHWTTDVMGYTHADVLVSTRPFYYISGSCWSMLGSLIHGATLVIAQRFDDAELLDLLAGQGATVMLGGQSLYYTLLDSPLFAEYRNRFRLRTGFFGGTSVKPDFVTTVKERFGMASIVQVYGMTELLGFATSTSRTDPDDVTTNTVGRPLPGFEFSLRRLDDPRAEITDVDTPGELWVRGNVLAGYLRDGVITDACDADGWFATSDVLSRGADGNWAFHSRIRDMVKVRGENVLLSEVDDALDAVPGVRRGVTFGIEDARDWHVEAMVEADGSRELTAAEVIAYCRDHLAPHKVPTAVWFLPAGTDWPVTVSGKVRRRELAVIAAGLGGTAGRG